MSDDKVLFETKDDIAVITINRPACRNAVDPDTAGQLERAFLQFEQDSSLKVAVFTGAEGHFCAGADLKAVASGGRDFQTVKPGPMGPSNLLLNKPVIAAVEGYAVAGGFELAMWCDMRVAASDASFGVFCRRWGVPLIDGGTIRLSRALGHSHALDLILTGRAVAGEEAKQMGIANRIVAPGSALEHTLTLAKQIAAFPQCCLRADRMSSYQQWDMDFATAFNNEFNGGMAVLESGETVAGAQRFSAGAGRHGQFE
ncbi:MAG: crotonase/enoyl-CoA hydratase family protein [Pseudomonadales bacterium]